MMHVIVASVLLGFSFANGQLINITSTWIAGTSTTNSVSATGTIGVPSTTIYPGARQSSCFAIMLNPAKYEVYIYGGQGYVTTTLAYQKDFWRYNIATTEWTQLPANSGNTAVTGTKGTESSLSFPGTIGRQACLISSLDNYLYMFGGTSGGFYNDLWRYNPTTGYWTWLGGGASTTATVGVESSTIYPIPRRSPGMVHLPATNTLLVEGGYANPGTGNGEVNDMWKFSLTSNAWTWIAGSQTILAARSVFDSKGVATIQNMPGYRALHAMVIDPQTSVVYLFGGLIFGTTEYLNDFWSYDDTQGMWVWISGGTASNLQAVKGTSLAFDATYTPGSRCSSTLVPLNGTDYLSMYGGRGYGIAAASVNSNMNEMWVFSKSLKQWAWVVGSQDATTYGTRGVTSVGPYPAGRQLHTSGYLSSAGSRRSILVYGGVSTNYFSDMWKIDFDISVSSTASSSLASSMASTSMAQQASSLTSTVATISSVSSTGMFASLSSTFASVAVTPATSADNGASTTSTGADPSVSIASELSPSSIWTATSFETLSPLSTASSDASGASLSSIISSTPLAMSSTNILLTVSSATNLVTPAASSTSGPSTTALMISSTNIVLTSTSARTSTLSSSRATSTTTSTARTTSSTQISATSSTKQSASVTSSSSIQATSSTQVVVRTSSTQATFTEATTIQTTTIQSGLAVTPVYSQTESAQSSDADSSSTVTSEPSPNDTGSAESTAGGGIGAIIQQPEIIGAVAAALLILIAITIAISCRSPKKPQPNKGRFNDYEQAPNVQDNWGNTMALTETSQATVTTTVPLVEEMSVMSNTSSYGLPTHLKADSAYDFRCEQLISEDDTGKWFVGALLVPQLQQFGGSCLIKVVADMRSQLTAEQSDAFDHEVGVMNIVAQHGCKHIVTFLAWCDQPMAILIKMYAQGTLEQWVNAKAITTKTLKLSLFKDVASGLQFLHGISTAHSNLTLASIYIDTDTLGRPFAVLGNLASASVVTSHGLRAPRPTGRTSTSWASHAAPEAIARRHTGQQGQSVEIMLLADIYSLGAVAVELLQSQAAW